MASPARPVDRSAAGAVFRRLASLLSVLLVVGSIAGVSTVVATAVPAAAAGASMSITSNGSTSCGETNGNVWCWGYDGFGQLGNGQTSSATVNSPTEVLGVGGVGFLSGITQLSSGGSTYCAVSTSGNAYCWGYNSLGQIGNGTTLQKTTPVEVVGVGGSGYLTGVTQISQGGNQTCAVAGSNAYCWGYNYYGQLGNGTTTQSTTPVEVVGGTGALSGVTSISTANSTSCAVAGGNAYCWGYNYYGQAGTSTSIGTTSPITTATQVTGAGGTGNLSGISQVSEGSLFTCATATGGSAYCWGSDSSGQLGNGSTTQSSSPVQVDGVGATGFLSGVSSVAALSSSVCALTSTSNVYCWGSDSNGVLGNNVNGGSSTTPVEVLGVGGSGYLSGVSTFGGSNGTTICALTSSATPSCWGNDNDDALGDNANGGYSAVPIVVSTVVLGGPLAGLSAISSGGSQVCGIVSTNVYCWGAGTSGQLGNGSAVSTDVPLEVMGVGGTGYLSGIVSLSVGSQSTCAVSATGNVYCWGTNSQGQLGNNSTAQSNVPVEVLGVGAGGYLSGITAVTVGSNFACAVSSAGNLYCWGYNGDGTLGNNSTTESNVPVEVEGTGGSGSLSGITQASAGSSAACAVASGGYVYCWGIESSGQLGNNLATGQSNVPVQVHGIGNNGVLSGITKVSVGSNSGACAVTSSGASVCWGWSGNGQLGINSTGQVDTPTQVLNVGGTGNLSGVTSASVDSFYSCWSASAGAAYCAGVGSNLGDNSSAQSTTPVQVVAASGTGYLSGAGPVTVGSAVACVVITGTGNAECWGSDNAGSLGNGSYSGNALAPTPVLSGTLIPFTFSTPASLTVEAPSSSTVGSATQLSATLTGGSSPTGSVSFVVFGPQSSAPTSCSTGGTDVATASVAGDGTFTSSTSAFTPAHFGDYWWYATYGGDANNAAAATTCGASMAETVVGKGNQTISFTSTSPANAQAGSTYTVTAAATSQLAVALSVDPSSTACTLSGATVTFFGPGTCEIDANQAGNADFVAASQQQQSISVALSGTVEPIWQIPTGTAGQMCSGAVHGGGTAPTVEGSVSIAATSTSGLARVTVSMTGLTPDSLYYVGRTCAYFLSVSGQDPNFSANQGTALISDDQGDATATFTDNVSGGQTVVYDIDAALDNSGATSFAETPALSYVAPAAQSITINSTAPSPADVGSTYTPSATATSGLTVTFSVDVSSGSGVCSISAGVVSFAAGGTCVIDANQAGNGSFAPAAQQQQTIAVSTPVTVTVSGTDVYATGTPSYTYTTAPAGLTVTAISCSTVGSAAPLNANLVPGSYTVLGSSCTGTGPAHTTLAFTGATNGFVVSAGAIPNLSCSTNAAVLSTGYDSANGGVLSNGSYDANWRVIGPAQTGQSAETSPNTATSLPPAADVPVRAIVGEQAPGAYYSSPYGNAQWISEEGVRASDPTADWFYEYAFDLSSSVDLSTFALKMNFYADNEVAAVYVNGVQQSSPGLPQDQNGSDPYGYGGFVQGSGATATLSSGFQTGFNLIVVQTKSGASAEGFLAQMLGSALCGATVTVSGSETYGGSGQSLSYTVSPASVNVSGTLSCAVSSLPAGTHTIDGSVCSGLSGASGVTLSYTGATNGFNVNPAPLVVHADSVTSVYGSGAPPAIGATLSGLVNGDTAASEPSPLCTTTATASSPVGSYATSCQPISDPNYSVTAAPGTYSVTPASLVVTPAVGSMTYGSAAPAISPTYYGFTNGDTVAELTAGSNSPASCSTTATSSSPVGGYLTTCSGASDTNYTITYVPADEQVVAAPLTITAAAATMPYGGSLPAVSADYSGFVNGDSASSLAPGPTCTSNLSLGSAAGRYADVDNCSGAADPDYSITYERGDLTVTPVALVISAGTDAYASSYGAPFPTIVPGYAGLVNSDTASSLSMPPSCSTTIDPSTAPGAYPHAVTCSGAADPNYTITYQAADATVSPAPLVISAPSPSAVYGAAIPTLDAGYAGFVNNDSAASLAAAPTCSTIATSASPVGTYPVTCAGAADPDYTITYVPGSLSVGRAVLTITASSDSSVYGTAPATPTASFSGFVNGDGMSSLTTPPVCSTTVDAASPAGAYAGAETCAGAAAPNYTISYVAGDAMVTPAALLVTASSGTNVYGSAPAVPTASYTGLVGTDAAPATLPTCSSQATSSSPVGTYANRCSGASDPNYSITYLEGIETVDPASLVVTASSGMSVYGAAPGAVSASYTGLVNGDAAPATPPTCSSQASATSHFGLYANSCSGASDPNYSISYLDGVQTVTAAPLVVTASSGTNVYGSDPAAPTASYAGLVNGDTAPATPPNCSSQATGASAVGTYANRCSGAADPDYSITYLAGTQTVTVAPLAVTASSASNVYGSAPAAVTASYTGLVNGDRGPATPPNCSSQATAASPVGTYANNCAGGADPDYSITYLAGTETVTPAALAVVASSGTNLYGAAPGAVTAGYLGLTNGDIAPVTLPSCSSQATTASVVGTYANSCSGAADPDYSISYLGGIETVTAAPLVVTASSASSVYGSAPAAVTASYTGFVNGDTAPLALPSCSSQATAGSAVGTYANSCSGGADPDYSISYLAGTETVTAAPLLVAASSDSSVYGSAPTTPTAAYTGFVNGDTAASLTSAPVCVTTVTAHFAVGSYPLAESCSGAADPNYALSYLSGDATVTAAPLLVTASDSTATYGGTPSAVTASYLGFVNGDTVASLTTPASCSTTVTSSTPAGTYAGADTCSGVTDPNYSPTYDAGDATVDPAALVVTASSGSMVYGENPPTVTPSYAGFVNGDTEASLGTAPSCTTVAAPTAPVGSYATSCTGAVDTNYTISYAPGTVTVTPAKLTVTASSGSSTYGSAPPSVTASYAGFLNAEDASSLTRLPTCSTQATASSPVGTYTTSCSGAADPNYTISYVNGTTSVGQGVLVITASSNTSTYGSTPPAVTASYSGFVNGDTSASLGAQPSCSTAARSASAVGTYTTTCSGAVDGNYVIHYVSGKTTVTPAVLVVTASSPTTALGSAIPAITAAYTGFLNGDTAASLTTKPTCTTTATASSQPGTYATSCSGAVDANYSVTYLPGTLTLLLVSSCPNSPLYGKGANLAGQNFGGQNLKSHNFAGANLTGANLSGANLQGADFDGANLTNANFGGSNLRGASFVGANLTGTTISGVNLQTDDVSCSDLLKANLGGSNLQGGNLSGDNLSGDNLSGVNLQGDNLSAVLAPGVNFNGSALQNVNFTGAVLSSAQLSGANLAGDNLTGATVTSANLAGSNVSTVDMTNAVLTGSNLSGANTANDTWSNTTCPDGTNSKNDGGTCAAHLG